LRHAVEVLGWIAEVHGFAAITGSTARVHAEPEPLTLDEVPVFLAAAPSLTHRGLFGLQIGNGLRPSEVIKVRWEDISFTKETIYIRGTKNKLAKTSVCLTPISSRELRTLWDSLGSPTSGLAFLNEHGQPFAGYPVKASRNMAESSGLNSTRTRPLFPCVCRHTFATIVATSGIDRAFTKDMMRQSRASTVLDEAYIRVSKSQTAQAFASFWGRRRQVSRPKTSPAAPWASKGGATTLWKCR
jgi:integrase